MSRVAESIEQLIGHTPLLHARRMEKKLGLDAVLLLKLEAFNPLGSAKDRAALYMIDDAEKTGKLCPGGLIVEPTSGNTGVGLAYIASARGYRLILTMPASMSEERKALLRALGAELVLTDAAAGMAGAVEKAEEIIRENPGAWMPGQFENPANARAHIETTAEEIWNDTEGKVDAFVAGVGSGGTITGVSRGLKAHDPKVHVAAVEPLSSPLLSGGKAGPHGIMGIGANFVPKLLDRTAYDEVIAVADDEAYECARMLAKVEGVFCGISSGAAVYAAIQLAKRPEFAGKTIVALLPDTGERYLSTPLFAE